MGVLLSTKLLGLTLVSVTMGGGFCCRDTVGPIDGVAIGSDAVTEELVLGGSRGFWEKALGDEHVSLIPLASSPIPVVAQASTFAFNRELERVRAEDAFVPEKREP